VITVSNVVCFDSIARRPAKARNYLRTNNESEHAEHVRDDGRGYGTQKTIFVSCANGCARQYRIGLLRGSSV
jgi:hypothetical protein